MTAADPATVLGVDLAVIGAGPAGLAAALTAAELGLKAALIDELPVLGGQYLVDGPAANGPAPVSAAQQQGQDLIRKLRSVPVEWRSETLVWHLGSDLRLELYRRGEVTSPLHAGAVILATGAREQVVPFPGWTLAGRDDGGRGTTAGEAPRLIAGQAGSCWPVRGRCCFRRRPDWPSTAPKWWAFWRRRTRPCMAALRPGGVAKLGSLDEGRHYVRALRQGAHPLPFRADGRHGAGARTALDTAVTVAQLDAVTGAQFAGSTENDSRGRDCA